MSKWEDKYNELKSNIDNMIQEQNSKMNELRIKQAEIGKDTASKEYKDLKSELKQANAEKKRLEQLKPNLKKVSNIIEFIDTLKEHLDELKKEDEFRKEMGEATKRKEELEKEIANYQERYERIDKELRNDKLSADEKEKLENEKAEISEKMPKAQDEWDKQDGVLKNGLDRKGYYSNLSNDQLDHRLFAMQSMISKCNMVAKNILEGKSWDEINYKLDNWKDRRLENKGEKLSKKDKLRTEPENDIETELENVDLEEKTDEIDLEELSEKIQKRAEFETKHPRLAKMVNWFNKVFKRDKMLPEPEEIEPKEELKKEEPEKTEVKELEEENKKEKTSAELAFREYLQQVAEKGMDGVAAEEKTARQQAAKEKLDQMRAANRAAEAKKFGQAYADKSDFREKNDDEGR